MPDRNIVDLAHAVLDAVVPDVPWKIQLQEFQDRAAAAPTLVRTVIDLTAQLDAERFAHANAAVKIKRVEDLVGRLEHEAAYEASRGDTWDATCIRAEARRIRKALNGETA